MTATERYTPFIVANQALDKTQQLHDMLVENGYLFSAAWDPKADLMDALWSGAGPFGENDPPYIGVYRRIVHLALFNELPQDPTYMDLLAWIVGGSRKRRVAATMPRAHAGCPPT